MLHAWFMLSFGIQQVYALLDLDGFPVPEPVPDIAIRRAGPDDRPLLEEFSDSSGNTKCRRRYGELRCPSGAFLYAQATATSLQRPKRHSGWRT